MKTGVWILIGCAMLCAARADDTDGSRASIDILKKGALNREVRLDDQRDADGYYVMELQNEVLPRALQLYGQP